MDGIQRDRSDSGTGRPSISETYTYDSVNQLIALDRGNATREAFHYDPTGNWSLYETESSSQSRTHNSANEITGIDGQQSVVHNPAGNMTRVPKPESWLEKYDLTYDAWNRLAKVTDGASTVATYTYDGLNRRVKKTLDNETRVYYYNRSWQCVEEFVGNTVNNRYFWGLRYIDDLLVYHTGSTDYFIIQDTNWNVIALSNATGQILERYNYTAFGSRNIFDTNFVAKSQSSYPTFTRTFTGQVLDPETHLILYRNRHYHPTLGRFVQRDPIGYAAKDINLARYVQNNPLAYLDTNGEWLIAAIAITMLVGVAVAVVKFMHSTPDDTGISVREQDSDGICHIKVTKDCSIVVMFGHGSSTTPHTVDFGDTQNSHAGFSGCYPGVTNKKIPGNRRIPGFPLDHDLHADKSELAKMLEKAREKAREILKKGCCPNGVTIQTVRVGVKADINALLLPGQETEVIIN